MVGSFRTGEAEERATHAGRALAAAEARRACAAPGRRRDHPWRSPREPRRALGFGLLGNPADRRPGARRDVAASDEASARPSFTVNPRPGINPPCSGLERAPFSGPRLWVTQHRSWAGKPSARAISKTIVIGGLRRPRSMRLIWAAESSSDFASAACERPRSRRRFRILAPRCSRADVAGGGSLLTLDARYAPRRRESDAKVACGT
jgi:hypothetical protein